MRHAAKIEAVVCAAMVGSWIYRWEGEAHNGNISYDKTHILEAKRKELSLK